MSIAFNYQCKTNGHDLISYGYQSEARNYQCETDCHNPQQGIIVRLKLGFDSVITIYALLYIT